jgi:hypothetical protein
MRLRFGFAVAYTFLALVAYRPAAAVESAANADTNSVDLTSGVLPGSCAQVRTVFEAAGQLKFRAGEAVKELPTQVTANFVYDEKQFPGEAGLLAARHYRTAEAKIVVDKTTTDSQLHAECRDVVVEATESQLNLYCPTKPLSGEQLDLLQTPASSLLIEQLLPGKELTVGQTWTTESAPWAGLLNLDAVSRSQVVGTLVGIDAATGAARLELKGLVQGAIGGVASDIDLAGRASFDPRQHRITWLGLVIKEKRAIGHVEPGVDITAKLQMAVAPVPESQELAWARPEEVPSPTPPEALMLGLEAPRGRYHLQHERRWHVMSDREEVLSLRMVDRGELVAQCNITSVPAAEAGKVPGLEEFQSHIRRSLGSNFEQFVTAGESQNSLGHTTFRVEAIGKVDGLEITWRYFLVLDGSGRQVVFAFTCETPMLERLGAAAETMVATLRWADEESTAQPTPAPVLR